MNKVRLILAPLLCAGISFSLRASELTKAIDQVIAAPPFDRAIWGILVEDEGGRRLYERNADRLVVPASNRKLLVAAAVAGCHDLGETIPTQLWMDGDDLVLQGGGDPSLGGRYAFDRDQVFAPFVAALRARGVRVIRGDLVADVSLFDRTTLPPSWKWGNIGSDYAPPVDALAYNENVVGVVVEDGRCLDPVVTTDPSFVKASAGRLECLVEGEPTIRVDAQNSVQIDGVIAHADAARYSARVAVADPALYAAQALWDVLARAGIVIRGSIRVNTTPHAWQERVAELQSQPLFELLAIALRNSQNLYAEMLFKRLGAEADRPASFAAAAAVEKQMLSELGIDPAASRLVDGSGLSPDDLITPSAAVRVLRWMNAPPRRGVFWTLLAMPGEEGTLRRRLLELAPRLRAKTGTVAGVSALSGIIAGPKRGYRYFSVVVNHNIGDSAAASNAIDAIAREIAKF